ncbi:MAG: PepSY domain-containing protein [Paracoccaceae bacterium]
MKMTIAALAFGMVFSGQMALALTADDVVADLQAAGYTRVEVRVGPTQIKVEAIRGTEKLETVYDAATGAVLKTQVRTVEAGTQTAPGVTVRDRNRDFVRGEGNATGGDDNGKGRGRGHDDSSDDHGTGGTSGSGHDDDDGSDDHGSSGNHDSGHDDNGSDDDSSDDDSNDDSNDHDSNDD